MIHEMPLKNSSIDATPVVRNYSYITVHIYMYLRIFIVMLALCGRDKAIEWRKYYDTKMLVGMCSVQQRRQRWRHGGVEAYMGATDVSFPPVLVILSQIPLLVCWRTRRTAGGKKNVKREENWIKTANNLQTIQPRLKSDDDNAAADYHYHYICQVDIWYICVCMCVCGSCIRILALSCGKRERMPQNSVNENNETDYTLKAYAHKLVFCTPPPPHQHIAQPKSTYIHTHTHKHSQAM